MDIMGTMTEDDPKYLCECEWVRRNGKLGCGVVIGREGNCLNIDASGYAEIRAAPFKVREDKVTMTTGPLRKRKEA